MRHRPIEERERERRGFQEVTRHDESGISAESVQK
jgi:hypothetical protein